MPGVSGLLSCPTGRQVALWIYRERNSVGNARAVSERTELTGGFPNWLSSDSWFPPREGGGGDGAFR